MKKVRNIVITLESCLDAFESKAPEPGSHLQLGQMETVQSTSLEEYANSDLWKCSKSSYLPQCHTPGVVCNLLKNYDKNELNMD